MRMWKEKRATNYDLVRTYQEAFIVARTNERTSERLSLSLSLVRFTRQSTRVSIVFLTIPLFLPVRILVKIRPEGKNLPRKNVKCLTVSRS